MYRGQKIKLEKRKNDDYKTIAYQIENFFEFIRVHNIQFNLSSYSNNQKNRIN